jgi:hypothetical protein
MYEPTRIIQNREVLCEVRCGTVDTGVEVGSDYCYTIFTS